MTRVRHRADVFLYPGQLTVQHTPRSVKTIVGSCVAVCLWDAGAGVGGMNHFLLAHPTHDQQSDARFGLFATERLIELACRAGAVPSRLSAAVIGGGHPVATIQDTVIGDDNVAVALAVLAQHRISVTRQETGGASGRKLLFNTGSGELVVRCLGHGSQAEVLKP